MRAAPAGDAHVEARTSYVVDRIEAAGHTAAMERNRNTGQPVRRQPLQFYRVRCGRKIWSPWLADETDAWWRAHQLQLARFDHKRRMFFPGPLTWIERGQRQYAGRRTVPMRKGPDGMPLAHLYLPTMPLD